MDHVCKSKFVFSYGANFVEAFFFHFFPIHTWNA